MRLSKVLVVGLMVSLLWACGREDVPPQVEQVVEVPTPVVPMEPVESPDLGLKTETLPEGLTFNQVEAGSVSFFVGGDDRAVVEITLLPDVPADEMDDAEAALGEQHLDYLQNANRVARERLDTPNGPGLWLLYRHDGDGETIQTGWLLAPHPQQNRVVSMMVTGPATMDAASARQQAIALLGTLEPLS